MATADVDLSSYDKASLPDASKLRIGIVVSQWNDDVTENLYTGAREALVDCGVHPDHVFRRSVPGSFELIYGCNHMQRDFYPVNGNSIKRKLDAVIAIGSVIRGETAHFDFVCQGVTQGIKDLNLNDSGIPVIFCVLTDDNKEQSLARSGGKHGNKGVEAATAAIQMACFKRGGL